MRKRYRSVPQGRPGVPTPSARRAGEKSFEEFTAAELYCPRCQRATPVRERLLLVLPDGELYEYLCARCGCLVGEKTARGVENIRIVMA